MSSIWLVICSLSVFALAYRYYGVFLAAKVMALDNSHPTPAHLYKDGVDYHPTNKWVLFGHHFAAISGAGPLIGPVLAAQWGFLPSFSWIIIGSCLAGAVHDFIVLCMSVRYKGLSLPEIARSKIGASGWLAVSIVTLFSLISVLASTAVVVINALAHSSWSVFVILITIIAALITGLWMYKIRPGKIGEASLIGVVIVLFGVFLGQPFALSSFGHFLIFNKSTLSVVLPAYTLIASILPVWILMCPRDYLSSYMKIGVMIVLAFGTVIANPELRMPATVPFGENGPIIKGSIWPFLCITIMCGAISGWHALVSSGTTPKMIDKEMQILPIGIGAMLTEGFVAVMALISACSLHPGDYFAINIHQDTNSQKAAYIEFVKNHSSKDTLDATPYELKSLEEEMQEELKGRTGGGVTLAVGMSEIFSRLPGMKKLASYFYHFVIMFEALFILTLLETGTRVGRYILYDLISSQKKKSSKSGEYNWSMNVITSLAVCSFWGYLLYTGTLDSLWTLFGIANQLLASTSLALGTIWILEKSVKKIYALTTAIPCCFLIITAIYAGIKRIFEWADSIPSISNHELSNLILHYILIGIAGTLIITTCYTVILLVRRFCQIK